MSSTPYMKFYPGDFLGDILHFSQAEVGAYILIICAMWRAGGFIRDEKSLRRAARGKVTANVLDKLGCDERGFWQKRVLVELNLAGKKRIELSRNGKAGARAKALKNNKPAQADACENDKQTAKQNASIPIPEVIATKEEHKNGSSFGWAVQENGDQKPKREKPRRVLPADWLPQAQTMHDLGKEGFTNEEFSTQFPIFRDYWRGTGKPMKDWDATFRNWMRKSREFGGRRVAVARAPIKSPYIKAAEELMQELVDGTRTDI